MNARARTARHMLRLRRRYGAPGRAWSMLVHLPAMDRDIFLPHLLHPSNQRDSDGRINRLFATAIFSPHPPEWWGARGYKS